MSAVAVEALAATRAPLRRCSSLMPPAWSKWTCELTISFTSSTLKPSVRMLPVICGTDSGSAPSISTCPASDVMSSEPRPCVPTQ